MIKSEITLQIVTLKYLQAANMVTTPVTSIFIMGNLLAFELVGLAQAALKEARERVKSALKNSGYKFPNRKIIVNLAPADLKKEGSHFDLAIARGILLASEQLTNPPDANLFFTGELSLDGSLRQVPNQRRLPFLLSRLATPQKPVWLLKYLPWWLIACRKYVPTWKKSKLCHQQWQLIIKQTDLAQIYPILRM